MQANAAVNDVALFVDRLIEEKELSALEPDILSDIKKELRERVQDKVNMTIVTNLPEGRLAEFNALAKKNDLPALQLFCQEAVPDLTGVVATALLEFRSTYLGL